MVQIKKRKPINKGKREDKEPKDEKGKKKLPPWLEYNEDGKVVPKKKK